MNKKRKEERDREGGRERKERERGGNIHVGMLLHFVMHIWPPEDMILRCTVHREKGRHPHLTWLMPLVAW